MSDFVRWRQRRAARQTGTGIGYNVLNIDTVYRLILPIFTNNRPVYVIDGSAGAELDHTLLPTRPSIFTQNKDFGHWGYSRVSVDVEKGMTFTHYRTDNSVADEVILQPIEH